jgi:maltose O-acetyltransferase
VALRKLKAASMRTEKEKMLGGDAYNASDPELVAERERAHTLCQQFNALAPCAPAVERQALLAILFRAETDVFVTAPFFCDYGYNVALGTHVYFNFNCVVLDVAPVSIGSNTLLGPAVQIYTASHPMDGEARRKGLECAKPVAIGDDVWIGGGAIICPGVTIGAASVIGAGSVVTRDVPPNMFAAGNPCRVIRRV